MSDAERRDYMEPITTDSTTLTRRNLIKLGGGLMFASVVTPLLAACGSATGGANAGASPTTSNGTAGAPGTGASPTGGTNVEATVPASNTVAPSTNSTASGGSAGIVGQPTSEATYGAQSTPRGGKQVSFTYMRPVWGPATFTKNGPYQQELQQLGNVKIDVQIIPVADYDAKSRAILASGNIPDIMWGSGPMSGTWKDAQDQGAFLKINKYLDKYPAIKNAVPDTIWKMLQDEKGDIYFVPNTLYPIVPFFALYRKDLLDKANIPQEPKSADEFVSILEKIHKAYPDKYALSFAVGTSGVVWQGKDLATTFGVSCNGWMPSEKKQNWLIPWQEQPKQVDFYFWLQSLHKKGLIDPNTGIHNDPVFMQDEFKAGKSVVFLENYAVYPDALTSLKKIEPNADIGVMPPIGKSAGTRTVFPVDRGFFISAKYDDPDGFFDFLNWTLTDGNTFRRWGIKGKTYKVENGKNVSIPDEDRSNAYKGPQLEPLGFIGPFSEKFSWDDMKRGYDASGLGDKFDYIKSMFNKYAQTRYPDWANPAIITPTDAEKGTQLWENYMQSTVSAVIINHKTSKQDWTKAVKQWENAGGSKIIEERNQLQKDKSKPNYLK